MTAFHSSRPLPKLDPSPLLLAQDLSRQDVARLLAPYGFKDWEKADANLQLIAGDPHARTLLCPILADLLQAVAQTADPDQALNVWERFLEAGHARAQVFTFLSQAPHILRLVCNIFGNSPAMAETLIRDPFLIYWLEDTRILKGRPTKRSLQEALHESLDAVQTYPRKLDALRRFHRREMLRIGARDIFHVATVQETYQSLSRLAELVIDAAFHLTNHSLQKEHGIPHHRGPRGNAHKTRFVVLGMGKLGGRELNYSSDVDLVYVYESNQGETMVRGAQRHLSNAAYFQLLAQSLTRVLSEGTPEGSLFRVDLRLRPEGAVGSLAWALDEAVNYYHTRGRAWERLAFLKARPIAGDIALGRTFLRKIRPFVAGQGPNHVQAIVEAVRQLRGQIHQKIRKKGEQHRNVKLSPGGIRDIEFIVQTLQLQHVAKDPKLFESNTLKSLKLLVDRQYLLPEHGKMLKHHYLFLRDVEHKLQMVHELQTHTLPVEEEELRRCAIRMGYQPDALYSNPSPFLAEYQSITNDVQTLVKEILC